MAAALAAAAAAAAGRLQFHLEATSASRPCSLTQQSIARCCRAVLTFQRFPCRLCAVSRSIYRTVDARVYCSIYSSSSDVAIRLPLSTSAQCELQTSVAAMMNKKKIKQTVHESILSSFTSSWNNASSTFDRIERNEAIRCVCIISHMYTVWAIIWNLQNGMPDGLRKLGSVRVTGNSVVRWITIACGFLFAVISLQLQYHSRSGLYSTPSGGDKPPLGKFPTPWVCGAFTPAPRGVDTNYCQVTVTNYLCLMLRWSGSFVWLYFFIAIA